MAWRANSRPLMVIGWGSSLLSLIGLCKRFSHGGPIQSGRPCCLDVRKKSKPCAMYGEDRSRFGHWEARKGKGGRLEGNLYANGLIPRICREKTDDLKSTAPLDTW